jgi:hypothetical protein
MLSINYVLLQVPQSYLSIFPFLHLFQRIHLSFWIQILHDIDLSFSKLYPFHPSTLTQVYLFQFRKSFWVMQDSLRIYIKLFRYLIHEIITYLQVPVHILLYHICICLQVTTNTLFMKNQNYSIRKQKHFFVILSPPFLIIALTLILHFQFLLVLIRFPTLNKFLLLVTIQFQVTKDEH